MTEVNNNDHKEDYEFIKEIIKAKPLNKRKLVIKVAISAFTGAVFGCVACASFVLMKPYLENHFSRVEKEAVVIPNDENKDSSEQETVDKSESTANEISQNEQTVQQVYNVIEKVGIQISDYEQLYSQLYTIVESVNASVVTVTGVTSDTDWFNNTYENKNQTSGLIIASSSQQYLILTESSKVLDMEEIRVTFCDDAVLGADLIKSDPNTGLAVIAVAIRDMPATTQNLVKVADLGNSNYITQGSPVIAMGSPLGYLNSISYGVVTSSKNEIHLPDWNIRVLGTDIYGSVDGTGVLINLKGEVIGFINQNIQVKDSHVEDPLLTFLSISDLKMIIQKLSNAQDIAYLGVKGLDVTERISSQYEVPVGAYVAEVVLDSPAMYSGIQSGDVIIKIGNDDIKSFTDLENVLLKHNPNENTSVTFMRPEKDTYTRISVNLTYGIFK